MARTTPHRPRNPLQHLEYCSMFTLHALSSLFRGAHGTTPVQGALLLNKALLLVAQELSWSIVGAPVELSRSGMIPLFLFLLLHVPIIHSTSTTLPASHRWPAPSHVARPPSVGRPYCKVFISRGACTSPSIFRRYSLDPLSFDESTNRRLGS
jgi:hypothetical protein